MNLLRRAKGVARFLHLHMHPAQRPFQKSTEQLELSFGIGLPDFGDLFSVMEERHEKVERRAVAGERRRPFSRLAKALTSL